MTKNRYHFSFGNSTDGPIGYCAAVVSDTPQEAVERLQSWIDNAGTEREVPIGWGKAPHESEYCTIYFNPDRNVISLKDIDFWHDAEGNEHSGEDLWPEPENYDVEEVMPGMSVLEFEERVSTIFE